MTELPDHEAIAAREADRRQADYFRKKLLHHLDVLDEQSENFHQAMAMCEQRNDVYQVRRLQDGLRSAVVERRRLTEMISALEHRFQ